MSSPILAFGYFSDHAHCISPELNKAQDKKVVSCSPPAFSLFSARLGQGLHRDIPHPLTNAGPSKFIVLADMKSAIDMAWEHGGTDFQSRFDKSTAQAQEMKAGALRVL
jgi:hypothetical protein